MIPEEALKYAKDESKDMPAGNAAFRIVRPVIDLKKCVKTYGCYTMCPENAIQIGKNGFPFIDNNLCTGCLICLRECACGAITEMKEKV